MSALAPGRWIALVAAFLAVAIDSPAWAVTGGRVESRPWIVAIVAGGGVLCAGAAIAPRRVLTAAHCLRYGVALHVVFDPLPLQEHAKTYAVARAWTHPGFDFQTLADDVAVLELVEPAPLHHFPRLATVGHSLEIGQTLSVAGFGAGRCDATVEGHARCSGAAKLDGAGPRTYSLAPDPALPCAGDSGGPSFVPDPTGAEDVLVGIHSSGARTCGVRAREMRVDAYRDFVLAPESALPGALPTGLAPRSTGARTSASLLFGLLVLVAHSRRRSSRRRRPENSMSTLQTQQRQESS